jgi:hypothetical protein
MDLECIWGTFVLLYGPRGVWGAQGGMGSPGGYGGPRGDGGPRGAYINEDPGPGPKGDPYK